MRIYKSVSRNDEKSHSSIVKGSRWRARCIKYVVHPAALHNNHARYARASTSPSVENRAQNTHEEESHRPLEVSSASSSLRPDNMYYLLLFQVVPARVCVTLSPVKRPQIIDDKWTIFSPALCCIHAALETFPTTLHRPIVRIRGFCPATRAAAGNRAPLALCGLCGFPTLVYL